MLPKNKMTGATLFSVTSARHFETYFAGRAIFHMRPASGQGDPDETLSGVTSLQQAMAVGEKGEDYLLARDNGIYVADDVSWLPK